MARKSARPVTGETPGLWRSLASLYRLMSAERRREFYLVFSLMIAGAVAELAAIGAVLPFLILLASPGHLGHFLWLGRLIDFSVRQAIATLGGPHDVLLDPLALAVDAFDELVLVGNVAPYRFHPFTVGFDFGIAGVHCASMIFLSRGKTHTNRGTLVLRHLSTCSER